MKIGQTVYYINLFNLNIHSGILSETAETTCIVREVKGDKIFGKMQKVKIYRVSGFPYWVEQAHIFETIEDAKKGVSDLVMTEK